MKQERLQLITERIRILKMYYEKLCVSRLGNLEEMNKFLEIYNLQRMNHKETEKLNIQLIARRLSQ